MFCILSGDIISSSRGFFDTKNDLRNQEALDRIFDLVTKIKSEEDMALSEELAKQKNYYLHWNGNEIKKMQC